MAPVAVTLAALAAYRLGSYLPLPGVDAAAYAALYQSSGLPRFIERLSIVALGVTPIISVLLLVEVARLASWRFNAWAGASWENARRLERYVLIGALLMAAVQSYGIAMGLEQTRDLVAEPGLLFRLSVVATLVAGTAGLMWLAAVVSQHGLGSGIWLLLLVPHIAGLPVLAVKVIELFRVGVMPVAVLVAALAYICAAVAILVALAPTLTRQGMPLDRTLIWPLFIASLPTALLSVAPWLLSDGPPRNGLAALLAPGAPAHLAILAAVVVAVSMGQWQRAAPQRAVAEASPPAEAASASPIRLTALALAAIAVAPWVLTSRLDLPFLIDGPSLAAVVVVAMPVASMIRRRG
jgi:preprotein translocase subunit SecY